MKRDFWKHFDPWLLGLTCLVTLLGLFFIYDAGYARSLSVGRGGIPPEFKSQLIFLLPAILGSIAVAKVAPEKWFRWSKFLWIVSLLAVVAVPLIGASHNGAKRWIDLGPLEIQPAEFVKLTAILYMSGYFAFRSAWKRRSQTVAGYMDHDFVPKLARFLPAIWVLIAVILIEAEPDLGTGLVVAIVTLAMFFPGGVSAKSVVLALALGGVGLTGMLLKEPYRLDRIESHVHRWDPKNVDDISYQTVQSEASMASGGVFGVGIGAGRAKHVMPATTTDFIMATVGEEFGLLGSLLVLAVLGGLVWRLLYLASRAKTKFRMLVLFGVGTWIGFQTCVNFMMANGFAPAIGIPLPFISSGGSSLVALWLAIGLCQSMLRPEPPKEVETEISRHRRGHRRPRLSRIGDRRGTPTPRRETEVPRIVTGPRS